MSWFSEFAGKAEDLLNRVDKTAAVALQKPKSENGKGEEREEEQLTFVVDSSSLFSDKHEHYQLSSNSSVSNVAASSSTSLSSQQQTTMSQRALKTTNIAVNLTGINGKQRTIKNNKTDDQLLEFLNSPDDKTESSSSSSNNARTRSLTPVSIKEVYTTTTMTEEDTQILDEKSTNKMLNQESVEIFIPNDDLPADDEEEEKEEMKVDVKSEQLVSVVNNSEIIVETFNKESIGEENHLLRKEILSLNGEINSLQNRAKEADGENKRLKKQLEHWNGQISSSESIIRELREREGDLTSALNAKDSQLAVLRVRLQEADIEKKSFKEISERLKGENDRLLSEHTNVSGVHHEALESLKNKFLKIESSLRQEQELRKKTELESFQQYSSLEEEKRQLMENVSSTQKQLSEQKSQVKDLSHQIRFCRITLETARQDLSDYRQKAQRILQSKEKLICALKENQQQNVVELSSEDSFNEDFDSSKSGLSLLSEAGDDLLRKENDSLREELRETQNACEMLRAQCKDLEGQTQTERDSFREKQFNAEQLFKMEKQRKEESEIEIGQQKEELKFLREDLTRTKTNLQTRIKDRELEVEKLRKQLTTKSLSSNSQTELESRIRSLTENLIQKQTIVEALSTEKNSLVVQLERLEQKMKDFPIDKGSAHIVGISDESAKNRLPMVFNESPFDGNMTRRVKRAYSVIDSLSIRMGSFLRRYPTSRAFLLAYMAILHLWVFAVLITYQPEIHGKQTINNTGL